ncbi:MAG TPA: hypothetical protein DCP38_04295, partial [Acidobacteria bacterium]|nr:hypothetical protein [Acidobacteriota bacterium]
MSRANPWHQAEGSTWLGLFALTLFMSATLLFLVQPMFAKMVVPLLGGVPAVWTTCVVFYQFTLLAGYAYVHATSRWLSVRWQATLHLAVLAFSLLVLPIHVPAEWTPAASDNPVIPLLFLLVASLGLPLFAISASAPLLQRWFSATRHPSAGDPYFLYAVSNTGSLLALLSYPVFVEPLLGLERQNQLWAAGYGLLGALTVCCASALWLSRPV